MNTSKKLLINTTVLTCVSFFMRTVDVSFNVYVTNLLGASGVGLFSLTMTVYSLAATFSVAGIRLASTRLVAESAGRGEPGSKGVIRRCMLLGLTTGSLFGFFLFTGADYISANWIKDAGSAGSLRVLAFSLPFIAMVSAMSGYFTAMRKVIRSSAVHMAEQAVKILCVVTAVKRFLPSGPRHTITAVVYGIVISEAASFIGLFALYKFSSKKETAGRSWTGGMRSLFRIAAPDAAGTCARSVLITVEHLLIPEGFRKSGSSGDMAFAAYGTIHGMVLPILLYPSALLTSLSGLLIPELARLRSTSQQEKINRITARVLQIALLFSLGVAGLLYAFADNLSLAVYHREDPAYYIRLLAPLVPLMYLDTVTDGILKGLDQQLYSMAYNILDSSLCVLLVYTLLPVYAVKGYIFILFASEALNFFLSFRRLISVTTLEIRIFDWIVKPLASVICSVLIGKAFLAGVFELPGKAGAAFSLAAGMGVYILLLFLVGCISGKDLKQLKTVAVA